MKKSVYIRISLSFFLLFAMLSPTVILAAGDDGKKFFKQGMKYEVTEEWDKAVEQFALAITENPRNPEYRLHYRRSLFNASQMYMRRGNKLADENDFAGAYLAFRKAYAYDPVNELARSEMERMLRLQKGLQNGDVEISEDGTVKLIKTSLDASVPDDVVVPQKLEKLRDVPFPSGVDLQFLIKELAKDLDLNVLFEKESFRGNDKIEIELKNVTAAKALDYIFLQEGLFFQKVGPRTILVARQNQRQRFQQLVLRTFYLANASPKDIANVIKTAIPAQPGRTPTTVLTDDATNSITVRDTSENIALIGDLIKSLDKDRAEVVMDVAIYEVTNTDLLQFGNQITSANTPISFGGTTRGVVGIGGNDLFGGNSNTSVADIIPRAFGVGLVIPAINLIALQGKNNTKLIASTQIHAFNNEDSSARIGQRVPVRTAQLLGFGNNNPGTGGQQGGTNFINSQAASVVNYEAVGLTLKFKPLVFPNQDVQVTMEIESKDVAGGLTDTPTFTERTIKGTARVQNNKTLLLASVAQNVQSEGRQGLPLLGLIPIIGRLFSAPTKNNNQTDIVIAITPRVIRAPDILPEDLIERETGSLAVPTSGSLEAMIIEEERNEQLAAARRLGNNAKVQLPDQPIEEPSYVKSNQPQTTAVIKNDSANEAEISAEKTNVSSEVSIAAKTAAASPKIPDSQINLRPIDTSVKTLQIAPTVDASETKIEMKKTSLEIKPEPESEAIEPKIPSALLQFLPNLPMMKKGEKTKIAVMLRSGETFRSAVLGLQFDDKQIAVRDVSFGDIFGADVAHKLSTPFLNQGGKCFVSLASPKDISETSSGILAYIEIEALTDGRHEISFNRDVLNMLTADGRNFELKY